MALNYKSSLARYRRYLMVVNQKPLWKATFYLSLSLLLVMILLVVAIKPTATKIAELEGKIKQQRQLSDQLNDKIVQDQKAAKQLEEIRSRLEMLNKGLPATSDWKEWEQNMESLATQSGVQISTISIGTTPIKGKRMVIANQPKTIDTLVLPNEVEGTTISVQATGQYSQLRQFVQTLENTKRIIVLSSAVIDKQKDGTLELIVSGKIGYAEKFTNI